MKKFEQLFETVKKNMTVQPVKITVGEKAHVAKKLQNPQKQAVKTKRKDRSVQYWQKKLTSLEIVKTAELNRAYKRAHRKLSRQLESAKKNYVTEKQYIMLQNSVGFKLRHILTTENKTTSVKLQKLSKQIAELQKKLQGIEVKKRSYLKEIERRKQLIRNKIAFKQKQKSILR